jgi:hypothetical protein
VIEHCSLVDCRRSLENQFRSAHGLAVPEGSAAQGKLGALGAACVGGVLV